MLTFENTATATHSGPATFPTAAAYRGEHRLPHQSQETGRDLHGEQYAGAPERTYTVYVLDAAARAQLTTPYRYLVRADGVYSHTAFHTAEAFLAWVRAYAVTLTPAPAQQHTAQAWTARPGDLATWAALTLRQLS
ncbi:hypothetical protein ACFSR9_15205 [Deinococcus taklimakanensis]|uniref:Uncharacterized protein n=1 Tax=Deinococcus taklimakanensis TaxID=536443 RepID=A0ABW5P8J0_9DEIO